MQGRLIPPRIGRGVPPVAVETPNVRAVVRVRTGKQKGAAFSHTIACKLYGDKGGVRAPLNPLWGNQEEQGRQSPPRRGRGGPPGAEETPNGRAGVRARTGKQNCVARRKCWRV